MADDSTKEIIARLEIIEARIASLESRMNARDLSPHVAPPPVVSRMIPRPAAEAREIPKPAEPQPHTVKHVYMGGRVDPPTVRTSSAESNAKTEYQLGARLLPWAGAALVILAIIFGVTIAYDQGWITPSIIFTGGVVLCLGFIAVGQWLRDEREQFGQILTGIGSCGMYCTFAAGHLAQNLYDGKTLTLLFLGLSLVNLGYCYLRSSTAFLTIGVVGGFLGASMPLVERDVPLHLALHALILIPSAFIIARRKWFVAACLIYPVAMGVLGPAQWMDQAHWPKVASLYFTALVCGAVYCKSHQKSEWDPHSLHLILSLAGTAWIAFEVRDGHLGSMHIIGFGILIYLLSLLKWDEAVKNRLQLAASGIPLILAPWGGTKIEASFILSALALGLCILARFKFTKTASIFAAIEAALAVAAYVVAQAQGTMTPQVEFFLLPVLIGVITFSAYTLNKAITETEPIALVATLVFIPLVNRLLFLTLSAPQVALPWQDSLLWSGVTGIYILSVFSSRFKVKAVAGFATILTGIALVIFAALLSGLAHSQFRFELPLVLALAAAVVLCTRSALVADSSDKRIVYGIAAWPLALLFTRLGCLLLSSVLPPQFALHISASLGIVLICLITRRTKTSELWSASYLLWFIAVYTMLNWEPPRERFVIAQLGIQFVTLILSSFTFDRFIVAPVLPRVLQISVGLALFTELMVSIFTLHTIGMIAGPVITLAWVSYAVVLLILGFNLRLSEFRYCGLALIGATVFKLLIVDLATTPDGPRFLITLAVGLAMICGGYLYIRLQNRLLAAPAAEVSTPQDDRPSVPEV